jgi:hypothetical protein
VVDRRNWSTDTPFAAMIATDTSIGPCVFETSGERFSVQLTYSARKPVKSYGLDSHSSRWNAVSVT